MGKEIDLGNKSHEEICAPDNAFWQLSRKLAEEYYSIKKEGSQGSKIIKKNKNKHFMFLKGHLCLGGFMLTRQQTHCYIFFF